MMAGEILGVIFQVRSSYAVIGVSVWLFDKGLIDVFMF